MNLSLGVPASNLKLPKYSDFLDPEQRELMLFDHEGLRMTMPLSIASEIASTITDEVVYDLCCGVGTMSIACAQRNKRVIAIDCDDKRLAIARYNSERFSLSGSIEFYLRDIVLNPLDIKSCTIFIDPPWGGSATRVQKFQIQNFAIDVRRILQDFLNTENSIVLKLPFNFKVSDLFSIYPNWEIEPFFHDSLRSDPLNPDRPLFLIAKSRPE